MSESHAGGVPLLRMEGVTKSFPGVRALDAASLTLRAGSVHALMGENGAGKSTLMKCLFGVYRRDGGEIYLDGERVDFSGPTDAIRQGVAMVHQELNLALDLTVAENMWLGRFPRIGKFLPFIDSRKMREGTARIFAELALDIDPDARAAELSVSERQMIEIAKAISYGARIIVFDEPTSSLTEREAERLFGIIEMLRARGCGIIYISHKMAEILRICDTVTVMRDGRHIATEAAQTLDTDRIIRLMVGRELTARYPERRSRPGEVILECEGLYGFGGAPKNACLTLRRGEILGVAGLEGSGRTELLSVIFGLLPRKSGKMRLLGKEIENRSPREAIKNGFALLTEERRASGIFGVLSVRDNLTIAALGQISHGPFVSERRAMRATGECIRRMRVRTPSQEARIGGLSGGNQQKVILGRWLMTEPTVLMLDEPTRGIDVGAKYEIYGLLDEFAARGGGVIAVSSEMAELIGICDRIIVMSGGRIAGEVQAAVATQEMIMELAARFADGAGGDGNEK